MATLPTKEKRPTGITIFAVLFGIGLAGSIAVMAVFSMPSLMTSTTGLAPNFDPFFIQLAPIMIIAAGISAAFNGIIMYGLISGSRFLRIVIMILAIIGAIVDLFYFNVIGFIINIIVIWYLTQPHVKKYFGLDPSPSF